MVVGLRERRAALIFPPATDCTRTGTKEGGEEGGGVRAPSTTPTASRKARSAAVDLREAQASSRENNWTRYRNHALALAAAVALPASALIQVAI
jgi:hypothetical protein